MFFHHFPCFSCFPECVATLLCATCNVIEDEIHLFCDCVKYMSLRNNMYQYIFNSNVIRFNSQKELFIQLMTSTDEAVLRSLGVFINACNIS